MIPTPQAPKPTPTRGADTKNAMTSFTPALLLLLILLLMLWAWFRFLYMPGNNYSGPLPPPSAPEQALKEILRDILRVLSTSIGERNVTRRYRELHAAAAYIEDRLRQAGYPVRRMDFLVDRKTVCNLEAERKGTDPSLPILLVTCHYDTVDFSPGANDNGTGVAGVLALAEAFTHVRPRRTIRFLFFVNEEAPYFMTPAMGARRYADEMRTDQVKIMGVINLETIGYYTVDPNSQHYPSVLRYFFPTEGNFIAFVANNASREFLHRTIRAFRGNAMFPSEGAAIPESFRDICRSDHYPFWLNGYPGVMVTDTANFRYPHYHRPEDTPDKIDYDRLARVIVGLEKAIAEMTS